MFFAGQQFGRYTLVKPIGKGAYGEVWLAMRHAKFVTTKVAVKLPNTEHVDFDAIRQEAILWEQASGHPNVLPIIEADEFEGQVVIVSEYASDGTLDDYLGRAGKLPVKKAVELALGIIQGLEFLHSRRIVHRDIKPANVLLQGDTPRLTDFGMSRVVLGNAVSMQVSGTPYYMAPEAFSRKRDRQTDIWSFGVVLYEMLCGEMPFPGDEVDEICHSVLHDKPRPMPRSIPRALRDLVFKLLEKSPADRFQSAAAIRERLQAMLPEIAGHRDEVDGDASPGETAGRKPKHSFINHTQFVPERLRPSTLARFASLKLLVMFLLLTGLAAAGGAYYLNQPKPVPFRSGDKFGFTTWERKPVIEPRYDLARPFADNRALVAVGSRSADGVFKGKFGFVDPAGREVIELRFDDADDFFEKFARVGTKNHATGEMRYGFIDQWGKEIVPPTFESAGNFSESLAAVKFQGKWGYIDRQSATVVPFNFDEASRFSGGLAAVRIGDKYGYVDRRGAIRIGAIFDAAGEFSSGKAPVRKDGRAYYINDRGQESLAGDFTSAGPFSEGLAMVKVGGRSGFIDQRGAEAVPFIYECEPSRFSEGLAAVPLNGRFGYINKYGTLVIPFRYTMAAAFDRNLALVRSAADGREFYVSYDGVEFYEP